jgi:hypothetical protein
VHDLGTASHEFLNDHPVLAVVRSLDERRERSLPELRDAFLRFREGSDDFATLEGQIRDHLVQDYQPAGGPPLNLWGFRNDDESRFATRLLNVSRKVDGLDLDGLFRENLLEDGEDSERIQVLLAFGEFVAGLDAHSHAEGGARLGMGPATHFLTFAWHCLSDGHEPVFTFVSDRAIWALGQSGTLDGLIELSREWEPRLANFYRVAREIQQQSSGRPQSMRPGWAVEHVLEWSWARLDPGSQVGSLTQAPAAPEPVDEPAPPASADRVSQISKAKTRVQRVESGPLNASQLEPPAAREPEPEPAAQVTKGKRDLGLPKRTVRRVETRMFAKSGLSLDEALPPDRTPTPAKASPRPPLQEDPTPAPPAEPQIKTAAMWMREKYEREQAELEKKKRKIERGGVSSEDAAVPVAASEPTPPPTRELPSRVIPAKSPPATPTTPAPPPAEPHKPTRAIEGRSRIVQDANLARELFLEPAHLGELLACLEERGRVLLVGPPLSGKTHLARRLALHVAGHINRVLVLRMHPEQSYEKLLGTRGLLRRLCEQASADRSRSYALVLDELDAGDAARALGELPAALVERAESVTLPSGALFSVPRNLHVVATARSEPLDPALLGRFPLIGVPSNPDVLRRYLEATRPGQSWVADMLHTLNARLRSSGQAPAVGHAAFMDPELDPQRARRVWNRTVLPLLRAVGVDDAGLGYEALGGR